MSTFDGFLCEFPDIQVDRFRGGRPLACFLSHAHSDHLGGLAGLRAPFVYCSAATRALVLRLEARASRRRAEAGGPRRRTYAGLRRLLKPLPLDAPAVLELAPGRCLRVTLLDANHCPGGVMFCKPRSPVLPDSPSDPPVFENDRRAALYTGDVRCEPWFVDGLVRSPSLAAYAAGLRTLDAVYLDTTHAGARLEAEASGGGDGDSDGSAAHLFPSKAAGLAALLRAVARYPPETVFYVHAWTLGYEHVWLALANALRARVHVDAYTRGLYAALAAGGGAPALDPVAPALVGFAAVNSVHAGCLTTDAGADAGAVASDVRIHSCGIGGEPCAAVRARPDVVWIRPVEGSQGGHTAVREAVVDGRRTLSFSYARHASCGELARLLAALRPRDVWPCTVDARWRRASTATPMRDLFGAACGRAAFCFDGGWAEEVQDDPDTQDGTQPSKDDSQPGEDDSQTGEDDSQPSDRPSAAGYPYFYAPATPPDDALDSQESALSAQSRAIRRASFRAAVCNAVGLSWAPIRLASTGA